MKTPFLAVLAMALLGGGASPADEQADTRALLGKAMKAMGDEAKLAKLNTASIKGKITASEGGQDIVVTFDGTWQGLSQYRADVDVQEGGNNFKGVVVFNGDKGWLKKNCQTRDAPAGAASMIQNLFYAGRSPLLLPAFKDKAYALSLLGEVQVGSQAALGMSIAHKDSKDVSLYFDKKTNLPVKSEIRLTDPQGKEITAEYHYSDYKDFDGLKLSAKITIKLDNKEFALELNEVKALEKVDDGQFDRP
jgi:hypothetical protein